MNFECLIRFLTFSLKLTNAQKTVQPINNPETIKNIIYTKRKSQFYLPKKIKPFKRKHCPVRTSSFLDLPPKKIKKKKKIIN